MAMLNSQRDPEGKSSSFLHGFRTWVVSQGLRANPMAFWRLEPQTGNVIPGTVVLVKIWRLTLGAMHLVRMPLVLLGNPQHTLG